MRADPVAIDEVGPGLFRIEEPDGERILCEFVLRFDRGLLVVDAGLPGSPARTILPLVQGLEGERSELTLLLTHPDADHCGGTAELLGARPGLETIAHAADCDLLGDPERTIRERYEPFAGSDGIMVSDAARARMRSRLGGPFAVSRPLAGEERIGPGHVLQAPGHSAGHAAVWLPGTRTMVAGDAVMATGIRKRDGSLLYPPQFVSPAQYRSTIDRFGRLDIELLLCAHEPPIRGSAVADFLDESRRAVDRIEALSLDALAQGADTLAGACEAVHAAYGGLPDGGAYDLASSVAGVLMELVGAGAVSVAESARPRKFRLENA